MNSSWPVTVLYHTRTIKLAVELALIKPPSPKSHPMHYILCQAIQDKTIKRKITSRKVPSLGSL